MALHCSALFSAFSAKPLRSLRLKSLKGFNRRGRREHRPVGTFANSPAFKRRVRDAAQRVPLGTAERPIVPAALEFLSTLPGAEAPGYWQRALRDQTQWV